MPEEVDAPLSKQPIEVTAEDLADEEWGPVKDNKKKEKKGKKKGKSVVEDEEEEDGSKAGV
jgi:translation initiation factor 5B